MGADASENAANAQANSAREANDLQWRMFDQTRQDQAPYRETGVNALNRLNAGFADGGDFTKAFTAEDMYSDPGYNFRLDEGRKNLERSAAARGLLGSGGVLKGITKYGQDYASGEYTNAFNRFQLDQSNKFNRNAALAGIGQTAAQQLGQQSQNLATNVGNNIMGAGNARASGYVGGANAMASGFAGAQNNYYGNQLLNKLGNRGGGNTYSAPWEYSQPEYGY